MLLMTPEGNGDICDIHGEISWLFMGFSSSNMILGCACKWDIPP